MRGAAGTQQAAGPQPGARRQSGEGPPLPEGEAPPPPHRGPLSTLGVGRSRPAQRLLRSDAARTPAPPPLPPRPTLHHPAAAARTAARLTSAALWADGRSGGRAAGSAGAAACGGAGARAPTLFSASSGRREPQGASWQPHHAAARSRIEGQRRAAARETGAQRRAGGGACGG